MLSVFHYVYNGTLQELMNINISYYSANQKWQWRHVLFTKFLGT